MITLQDTVIAFGREDADLEEFESVPAQATAPPIRAENSNDTTQVDLAPALFRKAGAALQNNSTGPMLLADLVKAVRDNRRKSLLCRSGLRSFGVRLKYVFAHIELHDDL